jgi:adenylate cyclase
LGVLDDLWGNTVNVASRMESEGFPGSIQLAPATYELIKDAYVCEARGRIPVKGKLAMETYLLISRRPGASSSTNDAR